MANLSTNFAGLNLKNPLIAASSGKTSTVDKCKQLEEAGIGAIVLKSLFEEQIEMQSKQMLEYAQSAPEAHDYILGYVQSHAVDEYLKMVSEAKAACSVPIIASLNCYKSGTWFDFAQNIQAAGASAIELNIFTITTNPKLMPNDIAATYVDIVAGVAKRVSIPVVVKLGRNFSNIVGMVSSLYAAGAAGVVLFNRYHQPDIDIYAETMTSADIFSHQAEISETLRWTALVAGNVGGMSLASSTGVHTWGDAVKCLLAGASAVQLCSVLYKQGNGAIAPLLNGIEQWMDSKKYMTVGEFKGKLNAFNADDAAMYERAQFMRYFSDRKDE